MIAGQARPALLLRIGIQRLKLMLYCMYLSRQDHTRLAAHCAKQVHFHLHAQTFGPKKARDPAYFAHKEACTEKSARLLHLFLQLTLLGELLTRPQVHLVKSCMTP